MSYTFFRSDSMKDNIAIAEPMTDDITPTLPDIPRRHVVPIEDIIAYRKKGLSLAEIAKLTGRCKQTIHERLESVGYSPESLDNFIKHRGDVLAHFQSKLLNSLTPEAINEMYPHQRVLSAAILYDKERLERGKSTQNINVAEVTASIEELRKEAVELRKSL